MENIELGLPLIALDMDDDAQEEDEDISDDVENIQSFEDLLPDSNIKSMEVDGTLMNLATLPQDMIAHTMTYLDASLVS